MTSRYSLLPSHYPQVDDLLQSSFPKNDSLSGQTRRKRSIWRTGIVMFIAVAILIFTFLQVKEDIRSSNKQAFDRNEVEWKGKDGRLHYAVVTTLYSENYLQGALVLGHGIDRFAKHPVDRLLLYIPGQLSDGALCELREAGWKTQLVERIGAPSKFEGQIHEHFRDQFTKLRIWQLTQYKKLLYIDSDCMVVDDLTSIFSYPVDFAAVPDIFGGQEKMANFNAGVLYIKPDRALYETFTTHLVNSLDYPAQFAEQGFLNSYYKYTAHRLPYEWNANLAIRSWPEEWRKLLAHAKVIHFTLQKPMVQGLAQDGFKLENDLWYAQQRDYNATFITRTSKCWQTSSKR